MVDDGGTNDEGRMQEDTAELLMMEGQQMMVDAPATDVLTSNVGPGIQLDFVEVAQQESRIASGYAVRVHCPS